MQRYVWQGYGIAAGMVLFRVVTLCLGLVLMSVTGLVFAQQYALAVLLGVLAWLGSWGCRWCLRQLARRRTTS